MEAKERLCFLRKGMSISYPIGESGHYLTFERKVLDHFDQWRQLKPKQSEAGGQLFGVVESGSVKITLATGPRKSDRRGRFFFIADRIAERREIKNLHKSGLHYFGDWHTHAEAFPIPSRIDIESMADLFVRSRHELNALLMVIVGTSHFPDGLHISIHENHAWAKLERVTK